jgi:ABC-type Na+ efflux pump permease subunit
MVFPIRAAGDQENRTLALMLATSASRSTFLAAKIAAMVAPLLIVSVAIFTGLVVGNMIGHMGIGMGLLLASTVQATWWVWCSGPSLSPSARLAQTGARQ